MYDIRFFFAGITSQTTILMIPVNQLTNSNEQLVQTLAALNNSAASLNNIQMQSMQLPVQQSGSGKFLTFKNGLFPHNANWHNYKSHLQVQEVF